MRGKSFYRRSPPDTITRDSCVRPFKADELSCPLPKASRTGAADALAAATLNRKCARQRKTRREITREAAQRDIRS